MTWDESAHPRDEIGRFSEGTGDRMAALERMTSSPSSVLAVTAGLGAMDPLGYELKYEPSSSRGGMAFTSSNYPGSQGVLSGNLQAATENYARFADQGDKYRANNSDLPGQASDRLVVGVDHEYAQAVITHEYGHAVQNRLIELGERKAVDSVIREIRRDPPSGYALTDYGTRGMHALNGQRYAEGFAEAYAAVRLGEPDRWGMLPLLGKLR